MHNFSTQFSPVFTLTFGLFCVCLTKSVHAGMPALKRFNNKQFTAVITLTDLFELCRYEEKAKKHLEHHDQRTKLVSAEGHREPNVSTPRSHAQGHKRKAPLSNQQLLDELFSAKPQKKTKDPAPKPSQPLPCSVAALRLQLQRLSSQSSAAPRGLRLVNRLASQSAWVILCGQRLMLLNPFRVEEALLFKRLLENNILPAVSLQNPIQLTEG